MFQRLLTLSKVTSIAQNEIDMQTLRKVLFIYYVINTYTLRTFLMIMEIELAFFSWHLASHGVMCGP